MEEKTEEEREEFMRDHLQADAEVKYTVITQQTKEAMKPYMTIREKQRLDEEERHKKYIEEQRRHKIIRESGKYGPLGFEPIKEVIYDHKSPDRFIGLKLSFYTGEEIYYYEEFVVNTMASRSFYMDEKTIKRFKEAKIIFIDDCDNEVISVYDRTFAVIEYETNMIGLKLCVLFGLTMNNVIQPYITFKNLPDSI